MVILIVEFIMEIEKAMTIVSFDGFDECITRRMLGYSDFDAYYDGISR